MVTRYIFITGGVVSSLGKGIAAASLALLLQKRGFSVRLRKLDPYLNVDPGTMSPSQHGEVFVTEDGGETDLDLGHYERFTGKNAWRGDNITSGRIYSSVIARERRGDYLGATVQVIPHVTNMIKDFITSDLDGTDFAIIEIGGTVGDIESLPYLEAIRQLAWELANEERKSDRPALVVARQCLFVHLTLLPWVNAARELKTKPTQHSVKELQSVGIQPDILLCRSDRPIAADALRKIALFCNLTEDKVIPALDADTIYQVPLDLHAAGFDAAVCRHFGLAAAHAPDLADWQNLVRKIRNPEDRVRVALVGKYNEVADSYKSLTEALAHGGLSANVAVDIDWIDAEILEKSGAQPADILAASHAILVPGGYGQRGSEGKIAAVRFAREHRIPYLGICFGMQLAVIEGARHLAGMPTASSTEFGATSTPIVGLLTEWLRGNAWERRDAKTEMGGTMRLGAYPCRLRPGSLVQKIYGGAGEISERHRHRYEVNIAYVPQLEAEGYHFSGLSPDGQLPEIVERSDHPWFLGVQFHPELKSRPLSPHPLFVGFINAALAQMRLV